MFGEPNPMNLIEFTKTAMDESEDQQLSKRLKNLDLAKVTNAKVENEKNMKSAKITLSKSELLSTRDNEEQGVQPRLRRSQSLPYLHTKKSSKETRIRHVIGFKYTKRHRRISYLREPILKLIRCKSCQRLHNTRRARTESDKTRLNSPPKYDVCALIESCDRLKMTNGALESNVQIKKTTADRNLQLNSSSCSYQARTTTNNYSTTNSVSTVAAAPPCDVTISELASYFETLVHIPKKMSSMAEMMYI